MKRVQQGVTLIELMMVALTISIVMTVAMPVYQGYLVQARKTAAMVTRAACLAANTQALHASLELPDTNPRDCD
jgi:prepilin-type N-terminal cleavage/methylation domain-containing protein